MQMQTVTHTGLVAVVALGGALTAAAAMAAGLDDPLGSVMSMTNPLMHEGQSLIPLNHDVIGSLFGLEETVFEIASEPPAPHGPDLAAGTSGNAP